MNAFRMPMARQGAMTDRPRHENDIRRLVGEGGIPF